MFDVLKSLLKFLTMFGLSALKLYEYVYRKMTRGSAVGLRHYAANWKVTGSSPDEVNFFN
jgi:hypothetical protein